MRQIGGTFIDITTMLSYRPDGHIEADCGHWCLPGPYDVAATLLHNAALGLLGGIVRARVRVRVRARARGRGRGRGRVRVRVRDRVRATPTPTPDQARYARCCGGRPDRAEAEGRRGVRRLQAARVCGVHGGQRGCAVGRVGGGRVPGLG